MCHADLPTDAERWPAPPPPPVPAARPRPTGTAAIVVGIAGNIVGAVGFVVVWLISNITLNTCRYGGSPGAVDVGRARVWLSIATVSWAALPIIAAALAKRAERNAHVWYVIALGDVLAGGWAVAALGPWELCL